MSKEISFLLIESNPASQEKFTRFFNAFDVGNPVLIAQNGEEALSLLNARLPGGELASSLIIFCPVELPDMDGFSFVRHIRSDERFSNIAIYMLGKDFNDKHILDASLLGAKDIFIENNITDFFKNIASETGFSWRLVG
jgi:CheY-like chemotaxis protein